MMHKCNLSDECTHFNKHAEQTNNCKNSIKYSNTFFNYSFSYSCTNPISRKAKKKTKMYSLLIQLNFYFSDNIYKEKIFRDVFPS